MLITAETEEENSSSPFKIRKIKASMRILVSSLFLFYLKMLSVFLLIRMHLFPILISNNNIRNFKLQIFHIVNSLATDLI